MAIDQTLHKYWQFSIPQLCHAAMNECMAELRKIAEDKAEDDVLIKELDHIVPETGDRIVHILVHTFAREHGFQFLINNQSYNPVNKAHFKAA